MTRLPDSYAEQTYASPYAIVRLPHLIRYKKAAEIIHQYAPQSVLDYGAGDGHLFLELTKDQSHLPSRMVALEPMPSMADAIAQMVASLTRGETISVVRDSDELGNQKFDFITCFGVLEHMPLLERYKFYDLCKTRLTRGGLCLIDVPVEAGPTLLIKHLGRVLLKGRHSEYKFFELLRIIMLGMVFDPARFDSNSLSTWIQNHKGFDYRLLRQELEHNCLSVVRRYVTPFGRLPAWMCNQEVYYLVRPNAI